MVKRIAVAFLWFFASWYTWAVIASVGGLTPFWGPVLGATLAGILAGDPMHRIWKPRVSSDRINNRLESIRA